jgi:hypothetical protein
MHSPKANPFIRFRRNHPAAEQLRQQLKPHTGPSFQERVASSPPQFAPTDKDIAAQLLWQLKQRSNLSDEDRLNEQERIEGLSGEAFSEAISALRFVLEESTISSSPTALMDSLAQQDAALSEFLDRRTVTRWHVDEIVATSNA